ncbi:MAG: VCBS repeat-containing protein [Verrucomicrobia bacterium]|nr:VCBS repeat-containing protein [Verrucomicrobiota bacterium]
MKRTLFALAVFVLGIGGASLQAAQYTIHRFTKITLTDQFWCEGAYHGDFNRDGRRDVCGGPFWWAGPDFKTRHEFRPATKTSEIKKPDGTRVVMPGYKGAQGSENDYSDNFLTFTHDFNRDGWDDIIVYGFPGEAVFWYENPQGAAGHWKSHKTIDVLDNESPAFGDLTGDGKPEIICNSKGYLGYAVPDWNRPHQAWTWHSISPKGPWQRYSHGLGFGDVNGDGRADMLEANGWWEQPASLAGDPIWTSHPFPFAPKTGSCQMYAYDVNGDGLNDVITALAPHNYGLAWYEQRKAGGTLTFQQHLIMNKHPQDNKYGVKFSQPHAIDLADFDGDGVLDILTGKRFWAHGPSADDEPNAPAVLYWFKTVRHADKTAEFIPYLIDDNSGVGTQVAAADLNADHRPDVIVGNKKGVFVFLHEARPATREQWEKTQPKPYVAAAP